MLHELTTKRMTLIGRKHPDFRGLQKRLRLFLRDAQQVDAIGEMFDYSRWRRPQAEYRFLPTAEFRQLVMISCVDRSIGGLVRIGGYPGSAFFQSSEFRIALLGRDLRMAEAAIDYIQAELAQLEAQRGQ